MAGLCAGNREMLPLQGENGERTQWVVEPGVYKAGYLVNSADAANETATDLLWILFRDCDTAEF